MKKLIPVIAILGLFLAANQARAVAPDLIPIQGVLTDTAGTPLDETVTAVFSLYTTETGGTALYTETQSVLVTDGLFTAYMGDVTTLDLTTFRDNDDLWLGIQINSDAEMTRVYLGSVPFAGYAEWCGNHPTPDFADITGTLDASDLPTGVVVGALACTGTDKVSGVDSAGALVCSADVDTDTDTDTTYTAGTGLTLTGTTFAADTSVLQARVSGTCPAGQAIREIDAAGAVTCEVDDDTDTTYSAGTGMDISGTTLHFDATEIFGSTPALDSWSSSGYTATGGTTASMTLRQASITVPVAGHVVALARANARCYNCSSTNTSAALYMTISTSSTAAANTGAYSYSYFRYEAANQYANPTAYQVYSVGAGTHTYYLRGASSVSTDEIRFYRPQLLLFFIPD